MDQTAINVTSNKDFATLCIYWFCPVANWI